MAVQVSDFWGRRIDMLGRLQGFKNAANLGNVGNIFKIGGVQFPSTAGVSQAAVTGRCVVLYVTIENYASPMDANATLAFGTTPTCADWFGFSPATYASYFPGTIVMTQVITFQTVYAPGGSFGVKNNSTAGAQDDLLTLTAYGWAY